ncbi:Protein GDAP2 homolog [Lepeophtheirus salmonis]|uniref:Protein GDAP2 homolog n=1 Tax=Lepeophtheirus salmonis TaxID=72036 RepID=A0A7R8CFI0_LEPSM|nr:Protein GDAP2 homolog [Lepeophtheirus salmonis]CAF2806902.1 Protein GDAP2 homolog [Lepeophtheirus salmonis]
MGDLDRNGSITNEEPPRPSIKSVPSESDSPRFRELLKRSQSIDLKEINHTEGYTLFVEVVDPVSTGDYVVVYFHSKTSRDNIPSYGWIKDVYRTLSYRYKKNLKAFYIVHPTLWTKLTCWWFSTFMAPAIKNKIINIHALSELEPHLNTKELNLPMFITEHDMSLNGLREERGGGECHCFGFYFSIAFSFCTNY